MRCLSWRCPRASICGPRTGDDAMIGACTTPTRIRPPRHRAMRSRRAPSTPAPSRTSRPAPSRRRSTRRRPYAQDGVGRPRNGYEYARSQNPTRERLERAVADLEGGRHGIAFASGSATTAAIAQLAAHGRRDRRRRRRLRRHVPLLRARPPPGGRGRGALRRPRGRSGRPVGGALRADPPGVVRDAVEPAAQGHRHRRRLPRSSGTAPPRRVGRGR